MPSHCGALCRISEVQSRDFAGLDREDFFQIGVRTRNHVNGDEFAETLRNGGRRRRSLPLQAATSPRTIAVT